MSYYHDLRNIVFLHGFAYFVEVGCLGFVDFDFRMLDIVVIMTDFHP